MSSDLDLVLRIKDLVLNFYTYEGTVKALDRVQLFLRRGDTLGLVGETGCGKSVTAKSVMRLVESPGVIEGGQILFREKDPATGDMIETDILQLEEEEMLRIRGNKIGIVFQDPATYPNPVFRVGEQIAETITLHQNLAREALEIRIEELEESLKAEDISSDRAEQIKEKIQEYKLQLDDPPKPDKKYKQKAAMRRAIEMLKLVKMPDPEEIVNQYPHELSGGMRQRALIAMS
ncbi:ABC transporter ATP-binding protein, partial [Candidatus Thorarchaeota archaeon]